MVLDQLVRGLNDDETQKKVLSSKEEDFNLNAVEKVVIAEESSKASQKESKSSEAGYVARMSTFKKNQKVKQTKQGCPNCGSYSHNFRELSEENKSQCKAFGKTCQLSEAEPLFSCLS